MRGFTTKSTANDRHPNFEIAVSMRWSGYTSRDQPQEPAHGNSSSVAEALFNYLDYTLRRISQESPMIVLMGIAFIHTDAIDSIEPVKASAINGRIQLQVQRLVCRNVVFCTCEFLRCRDLFGIISPISPLLYKGILH